MTDRTQGAPTASSPSPTAHATFAPGTVFAGRFVIEQLIGRGAMGVVYRVRDEELGETVALKLLTVAPDDEMVARFRREVRLARRITHRNVARIHDIGERDDVHFLSMEHVPGVSLEEALSHGAMAHTRAARIGSQIAAGLSAAHEAQVVHRDLKPANVLLDHLAQPERAVITDFGIARAPREAALTHAGGSLVGTPAYMAPEQVLGLEVDARTDIYALGLVLYEMLTGVVPFAGEGDSVFAVAMARCRRLPDDPRTLAPVPDKLASLVMRCLAQAPADRPDDARAAAAELDQWLSTSSGVRAGDLLDLGATVVASAPAGAERPFTSQSASGSYDPALAKSAATSRPHSNPVEMSAISAISSRPFAPLPSVRSAVAVLPFRYRGPADESHLADALGEELIDVLSATRGLRVLSSGATERFRDERDPKAIGAALGVDAVVDATMQRLGPTVRITVRLIDVASEAQRWSERFEAPIDKALGLQDAMSQRIAEALRVEIGAARPGDEVPAEAADLYLNAKRLMRARVFSEWEPALNMLDQALAIAPHFRLAMAAHAIAAVRLWWSSATLGRSFAETAQASVARATERAPELAETHFASGIMAVQGGALAAGVSELAQALDLAPTYVEAHAYLGSLQCEAGRVEEGIKRMKLVLDLDPGSSMPHITLARVHALRGDREQSERHLAAFKQVRGERAVAYLSSVVRFAAWWGDKERLRAIAQQNAGASELVAQGLVSHARYVLDGEGDPLAFVEMVRSAKNGRLISMVCQLAAEGYGLRGQADKAMACLRIASAEALVDVDWLERCPALKDLREREDFRAVRREVQARAAGIWKA